MQIINIHEAKTHFSKLIDAAIHGEQIVIAKAGKPIIKLMPIKARKIPLRKPGSLRGKIHMADDFDAPLPKDLLESFYE